MKSIIEYSCIVQSVFDNGTLAHYLEYDFK